MQSSEHNSRDLLARNYVHRGRDVLRNALGIEDESSFEGFLFRMNEWNEKETVCGDELIQSFISIQLESLGAKEDQKRKDIYRVTQDARILARLLIKANTMICCTLITLLRPENFDVVVSATRALCLGQKECLSLGSKMGHLLSHVLKRKATMACRKKNEEMANDVKQFKILFESEWCQRINRVLRKRKVRLYVYKSLYISRGVRE